MTKLKCNINKCPFRVRDLQKEECPWCKYFRRYENRGGQMYIVCAGTIDLFQMQIPFEE